MIVLSLRRPVAAAAAACEHFAGGKISAQSGIHFRCASEITGVPRGLVPWGNDALAALDDFVAEKAQ